MFITKIIFNDLYQIQYAEFGISAASVTAFERQFYNVNVSFAVKVDEFE